jgi:hypothetical protein
MRTIRQLLFAVSFINCPKTKKQESCNKSRPTLTNIAQIEKLLPIWSHSGLPDGLFSNQKSQIG